jgi:hypothetical protein
MMEFSMTKLARLALIKLAAITLVLALAPAAHLAGAAHASIAAHAGMQNQPLEVAVGVDTTCKFGCWG